MKKILMITMRLLILFILTIVILFGINFYLKFSVNDFVYNIESENELILQVNRDKLKVSDCVGFDIDDYTWLYKNETLKEKSKKRILIVGDSFVWGWMNNNANTIYWKHLQRMFEENGYNDIEIIAAARPAISSYEELEYILENEEYMKKIDPDLVILGFLYNDWNIIDSSNEFYIPKFNFDDFVERKLSGGIYKFFKKLYPNIYDWYINNKVTKMLDDKDYNKNYGDKYGYYFWDLTDLREVKDLDDNIKQYEEFVVKRLSELNYPLIVFHELFPQYDMEFGKTFEEQALELFKKYNLKIFSPKDSYKKLLTEHEEIDLLYKGDELNPSEILNNFYAEMLFNYLIENYSDIVGSKSKISEFDIIINDYYPYTSLKLEKIGNYKYNFEWPNADEMPFYWTKTSTIKLNLKYPLYLSELKLSGNFKNARIWINPENGQNDYIELLNEKNSFKIKNDIKVASINIHVEAKVGEKIELEIKK